MTDFEKMLSRSHELSETLVGLVQSADAVKGNPRCEPASAAAQLSFEHGHAMRMLFKVGTPNSACVLLRAQYEALLRSAWLLYAATSDQVERLSAPLSEDAAAAAKNIAGAEEMLRQLERRAAEAPELKGLVEPLREIRRESWQAMNSFVHGGIHALERTRSGFPVGLAINLLKNSNGMLHMAARLLARLTTSAALVAEADGAYSSFIDCLPVVSR
jgi:hypothetical protein